ncbi:nitrogen regulation protein NR(II) [Alicyclobacillus sp. SO9]|uniref:two-component system sensor histidine kinase NtrB n=1 Tax=Alicyclobacillus sp. SO9 TaxID=2665646 RepID=UPI0018E719C7|nr:ATP-binding protein [Alicyclobacillus sp. SO9]QQE79374.1 GHKL domain-containing protein [Alicyclobacillus sp. SO9]
MAEAGHLDDSICWDWARSLNWGVIFIHSDLTVRIENQLGASLLDTGFEEDMVVPLADCLPSHSDEYRVLQDMVYAQREFRDLFLLWQTNGRVRHVLLDSYRIRREDGTVAGMRVIAKDLGNFISLEKRLQQTNRLLTTSKVAAGIAHEIRNPLTTIKGFVQVLDQVISNLPAQMQSSERNYVDTILSEVERVEYIVTDLLMLANPRRLEKTECSIKDLLVELEPVISERTLSQNIQFEYSAEDLPLLELDKEMMKHAMLNLIDNAIEAMADETHGDAAAGILKIHAQRVDDLIRIDISDSGPGIPYYETDKIFDAFFTTKDGGIGLGLPICQRIVSDHDGEIRVSSKGYGTTFSVFLPLSASKAAHLSSRSG